MPFVNGRRTFNGFLTDAGTVNITVYDEGDLSDPRFDFIELIGDSIQSSRPATCLRYIHDFQNAAKFDTLFIDTLTWKIAAKLVMVLSGDMQLSSQAEQQYVRRLADAKARNASAARKPNILSRSLSRARFGAIGGTGSGFWEAFPAGSVIVG